MLGLKAFVSCVQSLKATYESLAQDLRKIKEVYHHRKGGTDLSWERKMEELTISVVEYVGARRDMIDLYPHLEQHGVVVFPSTTCLVPCSFPKICVEANLVFAILLNTDIAY